MNELRNWKRQDDGTYLAHDHYWTYEVGRSETRMRSGWYLKGWPSGNPEAAQVKRDFSRKELAQRGVDASICGKCMRHLPFRELEQIPARSMAFTCRDTESCQAEDDRRREEAVEAIRAERRRPHDNIYVRNGRYGPELVFETGVHGTVINVSEADLDYLQSYLARRRILEAALACPECLVLNGQGHKMDCSRRGEVRDDTAPDAAEADGPEGSLAR